MSSPPHIDGIPAGSFSLAAACGKVGVKTPRLIAPRLRKTRPRGWGRWAFSPSGLEEGAVLTSVSRSVISVGFALPRDAGVNTGAPYVGDVAPSLLPRDWRWEFRGLRPRCRSEDRRSYPAFLPGVPTRRSYPAFLPCGERCWCDDRRSWRGGSFVATPFLTFGRPGIVMRLSTILGGKRFHAGGKAPVRAEFSWPCGRRPVPQRSFPQNVDNVENSEGTGVPRPSLGSFSGTGGGLEFRRNTRTGWIVDSGYLIVRRPSGP